MKNFIKQAIAGSIVGGLAGPASAAVFELDLSTFLLFSDTQVWVAGASLYSGDIGSNTDVWVNASETTILGSVYSGDTLRLRSPSAVGSDGNQSTFLLEPPLGNTYPTYDALTVQVIANGAASIENGTQIWGDFDAGSLATGTPTVSGDMTIGAGADTISTVTLQSASTFSAGTTDIDCKPNCGGATPSERVITADRYGDLEVGQNITLTLEGDTEFIFNSIDTLGGTRLNIDLTNGPVDIKSVGDISFGQDTQIFVKECATCEYVRLDTVPYLASEINWETKQEFILGGGDVNEFSTIFGGNVFSSWSGTGAGVSFGQHLAFWGTIRAYDDIHLLDHSQYTFVSSTPIAVPEPGTLSLLGAGLITLALRRRKRPA